jgi:hypothetical protein
MVNPSSKRLKVTKSKMVSKMNRGLLYISILLLVALPLVFASCAGGSSNSTPVAKLGPDNSTVTSQPEASQISIPVPDKAKLPVIVFSVSPASIAQGATAVLSWNVTNATSVSIDHGIGNVPVSGKQNVSPSVPTTYKLVATNEAGSAIKTVSLIVAQPASPSKTTGK